MSARAGAGVVGRRRRSCLEPRRLRLQLHPATPAPRSFLIGFWPAYGLLTPLILGLITLGSLLVFHFIPFC